MRRAASKHGGNTYIILVGTSARKIPFYALGVDVKVILQWMLRWIGKWRQSRDHCKI
jgi:hypothetical protein